MLMAPRLHLPSHSRMASIRIAPPAKHVLVLGDKSDVDTYIRQQSVRPCQDKLGHPIFISVDDIQFQPCPMRDIESYLTPAASSPKFDAIVLTSHNGTNSLQTERTIAYLGELKKAYPGSQVLVDGFLPKTYVPRDDVESLEITPRSFAIPMHVSAVVDDLDRNITIRRYNCEYRLATPIDRMCVNSRNKASDLRHLLVMPELPVRQR